MAGVALIFAVLFSMGTFEAIKKGQRRAALWYGTVVFLLLNVVVALILS